MNSFLLFSNEIRPILQAKYKGNENDIAQVHNAVANSRYRLEKSNAQISKLIGEQWHKMDSEKKKAYVDAAEKIKEVRSIYEIYARKCDANVVLNRNSTNNTPTLYILSAQERDNERNWARLKIPLQAPARNAS